MSEKFDELRKAAEGRGDMISPLLPAKWIELKGKFTSKELLSLSKEIDKNFNKINTKK